MSTYADPSKAFVWLDGDVFRAPAGTALPADPFAPTVVTGSAPGVTWDAYGGIETGFEVNPSRDITNLNVWNRRGAPYKVIKGVLEENITFRASDYSKATVLTALQGGAITQVGATDVYKWEPGDDEDFALIFRLTDEDDAAGFYCDRVTLTTPPPRVFGGETLDGFDFEVRALSPIIPITNWSPLTA